MFDGVSTADNSLLYPPMRRHSSALPTGASTRDEFNTHRPQAKKCKNKQSWRRPPLRRSQAVLGQVRSPFKVAFCHILSHVQFEELATTQIFSNLRYRHCRPLASGRCDNYRWFSTTNQKTTKILHLRKLDYSI